MGSYSQDRQKSDKFIPQIKRIVGPYLLKITSHDIDVHQAADLMVFTAKDMRIAARVRTYGYAAMYPYEFTIRSKRDSGAETELSKIVNGWADWFFYGHADEAEKSVECWWLIDLDAFRAALIRAAMNSHVRLRCGNKPNGDGTHFKWFDLRSFPDHPPILIASSQILPALEDA